MTEPPGRLADLPRHVRILEVGPRDGLQSEARILSTDEKLAMIAALAAAGHRHIEVAAFVRPDLVPAMAGAAELCRRLPPLPGVEYWALVPNERGLEEALGAGIRHVAVLTAASETFCRKNLGASIDESLARIERVLARAAECGAASRAYVSTAFACPYEGSIPRAAVDPIARRLRDAGAEELVLADTIGAASPDHVVRLIEDLCRWARPAELALHVHDTRRRGLANAFAALLCGVSRLDASVGGLGGCPFAPGAGGNLATELLLEMLSSMGIEFAPDLERHREAAAAVSRLMRGE